MLKAKELRISGIGRFVEKQVIKFDSLGNLVQVDGVNNNTGGSSGSGKTTIFNAVDYLLGLNDVSNSVLKSRLTDESMNVEGDFDYDGKPLTIGRGKKLFIDLDGEITKGSSKLTEEKLDSILGMPRNLFRNILHKRQKEGGFFLKMAPKEINEFLMNCLGLTHFKSKIEIVELKVKDLTKQKLSLASNIDSAQAAFTATTNSILALGLPPTKDIHQSTILELKHKLDKSIAELNVVLNTNKIEAEQFELSRPILINTPYDRSTITYLEAKLEESRTQIDTLKKTDREKYIDLSKSLFELKGKKSYLQAQVDKGELSKVEAIRVANEIKKIRESMCPTCEQVWQNDLSKVKEEDLLAKVRAYKEDMALASQAIEAIKALEESILKLELEAKPQINVAISGLEASILGFSPLFDQERQKEQAHSFEENSRNGMALGIFTTAQRALAQMHSISADQARGQADIDRRAFDAAVAKLKSYEDARVRYDNSLNLLKNQENSYCDKVESLIKILEDVDKELSMAEELKRALKSYLSCSFDDALETISENATKLIRCIPNMANATIQLEGTKETQDGKIKDEVNAVIHMDGEENVDIRSLCGGERTSTDLAIDLSVIDLIETRANKGIDIFILDEPFDGLDTVCIEMALEVLKNSNMNKKLFIVDHNPEVKQMVESKLLVTRTGAFSKITQS